MTRGRTLAYSLADVHERGKAGASPACCCGWRVAVAAPSRSATSPLPSRTGPSVPSCFGLCPAEPGAHAARRHAVLGLPLIFVAWQMLASAQGRIYLPRRIADCGVSTATFRAPSTASYRGSGVPSLVKPRFWFLEPASRTRARPVRPGARHRRLPADPTGQLAAGAGARHHRLCHIPNATASAC